MADLALAKTADKQRQNLNRHPLIEQSLLPPNSDPSVVDDPPERPVRRKK
jgi:hypothetical protein